MRKAITVLLGLLGLGGGAAAAPQQTTFVDPASILFSTPTINNDLGALERPAEISNTSPLLHEDDWRQVEFYPHSRIGEVQQSLRELKRFELQHRKSPGWDAVFIRKIAPQTILRGAGALRDLANELGAPPGPAPILYSGQSSITGQISNGFTLDVSSGLMLYGVSTSDGVNVLGASIDGGDLDMLKVFTKLNAGHDLIAVDWTSQTLLVESSNDGKLNVWRP